MKPVHHKHPQDKLAQILAPILLIFIALMIIGAVVLYFFL